MPKERRQLVTNSTDERSRYINTPADGKLVYYLDLEHMRVLAFRWQGGYGPNRWLNHKLIYHIRSRATEDLQRIKDILE